MPIERIRPDPLQPPEPRPARGPYGPEGEGPAPVRGAEAAGRVDRVEISAEGRLLAAQLDAPQSDTMAPARVEAIRKRIVEGVYDTPEVIENVARKLIERGDLEL